jgi:uncharacterized protein (DUF362 family)
MKRRQFFKYAGSALVTKYLPLSSLFAQKTHPEVWELEGESDQIIKSLFSRCIDLKQLINKDLEESTVLIKPNLCLPHRNEMGTITSTAIINALCSYLHAAGINKIIIVDHTLRKSSDFQNIELHKVVAEYANVKLILANKQRFYQPINVAGKVLQSIEILKMLSRVDLLINIATAKHHSATHVSLALKNLMGLIWDRNAFHTRFDLDQAIADLALVIRPQLNLIDASRVLLNGGPTGPGPVVQEKRLYASLNILALDSVVVSRYNFGGKTLSAKAVPHLWAASQNSIGEIDLSRIKQNFLKV